MAMKVEQIVLDTNRTHISVEIQGSKTLFISFTDAGFAIQPIKQQFKQTLKNLDCDVVYVTDQLVSWYRDCTVFAEISAGLVQFCDDNRYERIFTIGNSMGAYGAILFGQQLGVDLAIAFAPQSCINPGVCPFEDRYRAIFNRFPRAPVDDLCAVMSRPQDVVCIFGIQDYHDMLHARRFEKIGVRNVILEGCGHSEVGVLIKHYYKDLSEIIRVLLQYAKESVDLKEMLGALPIVEEDQHRSIYCSAQHLFDAEQYLTINEFDLALLSAQRAAEESVSNKYSAWVQQGIILQRMKHIQAAEEKLRLAIGCNGLTHLSHFELAKILSSQRRYREARYHTEYNLKVKVDDYKCRALVQLIEFQLGNRKTVEEVIGKSVISGVERERIIESLIEFATDQALEEFMRKLVEIARNEFPQNNRFRLLSGLICAIDFCRSKEFDKIAIYGAGEHTRLMMQYWQVLGGQRISLFIETSQPKVPTLFNRPVRSVTQVESNEIDVIIISSLAFEDDIYHTCQHCCPETPVVRLYGAT